ncbi:hypothetical protein FQN49_001103 [Arthroderma sp. PD_2]|nr:hypothetical protein FQN49_001103 [Arthroderma sp. PD_2]
MYLCSHYSLLFALSIGAATSAHAAPTTNKTWPIRSYHSTDIRTPLIDVTKHGETEPGYIIFTPWTGARVGHPSIYQDDGELIWQGPAGSSYGFRPQMLNGQPVFVYWEGPMTSAGYGNGAINLLDSSYQRIHEVTLSDEYFNTGPDSQEFPSHVDFHEGVISEKGSMLLTAVNITQADLQSVGGPKDGWVIDALLYDVDIATNKVLFRWSAVEHIDQIPLTMSKNLIGDSGKSEKDPWDFFHATSSIRYGEDYLMPWGYGCTILHIARNGTIVWKLNGIDGGDFKLGPNADFCYQYGIRIGEDQTEEKITITMHNNHNSRFSTDIKPTTGLVLDLDLKNMEVSARRRLWNSQHPIVSRDLGSFQSLPNGHIYMNHGQIPLIEEYNEKDELVMEFRYGNDIVDASYRSHRLTWTGTPKTKPSVKACRSIRNKNIVAYVSWNGATDVESWKLYESKDGGEPKEIKTEPKGGFETTIQAEDAGDTVVIAAVGGPNDGVKSDPVAIGTC